MKRDKIFKFLDSYKETVSLHNDDQMKAAFSAFKKKTEEKSTVYYFFYLTYLEWTKTASTLK